jgi:Zn-dependent protease with chaperone function
MDPDPLWSAYHNTHPSLIERLRAIESHKARIAKKRE